MIDMSGMLEAPCKCCGYNGPNYWQKGTHHHDCPLRTMSAGERGAYVLEHWGHVLQAAHQQTRKDIKDKVATMVLQLEEAAGPHSWYVLRVNQRNFNKWIKLAFPHLREGQPIPNYQYAPVVVCVDNQLGDDNINTTPCLGAYDDQE